MDPRTVASTLRRPRWSHLRRRGGSALARRFGIDVRALAALRIALGLLLLADLLLRSRNLVAFYTDDGVLPRPFLAERYPAFARFSLHSLSGEAWAQALLFVVAAGFALSLLAGYRTTTVTLVSWLLLVSLHARNPLVLNGGDSVLRRLLFWGLFLPLGERWSADALLRDGPGHERSEHRPDERSRERRRTRVAGVASAALLVQVVVVYSVNAVLKLRGDVWRDGEAILTVFSLEQLTVFLGDVLAGYPSVLRLFGDLWLVLVVSSALLLLLTGWPRALFVSLFAGMHLGMLLTMKLGLFPLVSVTALLPFLPSPVWNAVEAHVEGVRRRLPLRRPSGVLHSLPSSVGPSLPEGVTRVSDRLIPAVVAALLVAILLWNAASLGYVDTPEVVESNVEPGQFSWNMFAPAPLSVDGWYVVPGTLESGERIDAFRGGGVRWEKPAEVDKTYPSARWRKYLQDVRWTDDAALRRHFADYLCLRWNVRHEDDLVRLTVAYVQQPTRFDGPEPTERVELLRHSCSAGPSGG